MDRGAFLRRSGGACLSVTLLGCAGIVAIPIPVSGGRARLTLADHPELTRPGGSLSIRPHGSAVPLYVVRMEDGSYRVLSSECTHRGCVVGPEGSRLVCPCHGSEYDRQGRVLAGPATRDLDVLPSRLDDGVLLIDLVSGHA